MARKLRQKGVANATPEGPVEVSGVNKVADMTDMSAFAGLDFDKVWKMGEKGPQLRNIP